MGFAWPLFEAAPVIGYMGGILFVSSIPFGGLEFRCSLGAWIEVLVLLALLHGLSDHVLNGY
jgi:hypothetical protein